MPLTSAQARVWTPHGLEQRARSGVPARDQDHPHLAPRIGH
jgi:hypothetical protein